MKQCLQMYGFEGPKKYFWPTVTILKAFILAGRTVYFFQNLKDTKRLADLVATYPIRFMAVVKLIYLYVDKKRVDYFFNTIQEEFWDTNIVGPELHKKLQEAFSFTNKLILIHFTTSCVCLTVTIRFPIVDVPEGMRPLPNIIWTPFDTNPSPLHEILYVYMIWNLFLSLFGNAFYDALYIYCLVHLYVQYELLKELLKNLSTGIMEGASDLQRFKSSYFQEKVMERIKICVEHHNKLLEFGLHLEKYGSIVLIPQLVMSYLALVVNGFILTLVPGDETSDISNHCQMVVVLSHLHKGKARLDALLNNKPETLIAQAYDASKVMSGKTGEVNKNQRNLKKCPFCALLRPSIKLNYAESISILAAVIESEWDLFTVRIKRALTLILYNSEKGTNINAAGMTNLNNELLVSIVKNAFSAITLLRALTLEP
nr:unnamed protein product [Callosobruchus analis]